MEKIIFKYLQEKYETQQNINMNNIKLLEEKDRLLEDNKKLLEIKDEEINNIKYKKYEEIEKTSYIYVFSTDKQNIYKIGRSKDIIKRKNTIQTSCVDDITILYYYKTNNNILLENIIHEILTEYRCKSNREHFNCNLDYIKTIIEIIGNTIDTLKSSYEQITKEEILNIISNKINKNINKNVEYDIEYENQYNENNEFKEDIIIYNEISNENNNEDKIKILEQKLEEVYNLINKKDKNKITDLKDTDIIEWFKNNYEFTDNKQDIIKVKDIYEKLKISDMFKNLTKVQKLKYNKTFFVELVETNSFFKKFYCNRLNNIRSLILSWK